jgi:hypothetical protein
MGHTNWSGNAYDSMKRTYAKKSVDEIFVNKGLDPLMSPIDLKVREARDSENHPNSLAIIVGLDETGSMGEIPEYLIRHKLGVLITTLIAHGISDPAVLFAGIGDHETDSAPLQVGQFESGTEELNKWLTSIYLEGAGGGQNMESYLLAWLFAARHTAIDCFEKRHQKGFIFTIGDEATHPELKEESLRRILGYKEPSSVTAEELLKEVQKMYHVYHIHANEGSYRNDPEVLGSWKKLLPERLIIVDDKDLIPETIASTVAIVNGAERDKVFSSFDKTIADKVSTYLMKVDTSNLPAHVGNKDGVIKL